MSNNEEHINVCLMFGIALLMFMVRLYQVAPSTFDLALAATMSLPVSYTLAYYSARAEKLAKMAGKFVARKHPEPVKLWVYEAAAFIASFFIGYLMFITMGGTDILVFAGAFIVAHLMRVLIKRVMVLLEDLGFDVTRPIIILVVAAVVSLAALLSLSLFFSVVSV